MISKLELRHFKRFRSIDLACKPLTVLTGANGAGKTSVIHALLLARSASLQPSHDYVDLNGPFGLSLGDALDVLNRDSPDQSIQVEVCEDGKQSAQWIFSLPTDERALNLIVSRKPTEYSGALAQPEPAFTYLCAERLGPRDVLGTESVEPRQLGVGVQGEFTAQVLSVHQRRKVPDGRCVKSPDAKSKSPATLLHQVEAWMRTLVRPIQILAEWFPGTNVTRLQFRTPGIQSEWTRPPNMGFGVSYALPIVVAALQAPKDSLIVIENPEAHLHPAGQSRIGEFLAVIAGDRVQVLIETHSDHVINGIRRAVVEGHTKLQPSEVAIHFVRDDIQETPPIITISLDKTGNLSSWPSGFFDQTERDLAQIARKRLPKS